MKVKYQYTYFIMQFTIENYNSYILNCLKDKRLKLKLYNKEKYTEIDSYFSKEVKNILFKTLDLSRDEQKTLENSNEKLLKLPEVSFEYVITNETQAKMGQENGIFFKIEKIELMCFKDGIGFIIIKTYLDENQEINNVLNFNYKFKKLLLQPDTIEIDDKINIQTNEFKDNIELTNLVKELTSNKTQEDIYTYSYLCVDGEDWNEQNGFEEIEMDFSKLVNVLPSYDKATSEIDIIEKGDYIKFGISKESTALITNSLDTYNYTKLPFEFETKYLYSLIFILYQKALLKKINNSMTQKFSKLKMELNHFVNDIFLKEITKEELGAKLFKKWSEKLELQNNYLEISSKYDMAYKDEKIRKIKRNNKIIWVILGVCMITNIINVIILLNISK